VPDAERRVPLAACPPVSCAGLRARCHWHPCAHARSYECQNVFLWMCERSKNCPPPSPRIAIRGPPAPPEHEPCSLSTRSVPAPDAERYAFFGIRIALPLDHRRGRISLSMRRQNGEKPAPRREKRKIAKQTHFHFALYSFRKSDREAKKTKTNPNPCAVLFARPPASIDTGCLSHASDLLNLR